ncbi:hypothetical protein Q2T40_08015 [Winogradskyella maritima]|uniref:Uncharacterized protein n=1 Tax=Winogradskyella maritima TaxID=1517766 RepID=A0ABV8AJE5_9FLAO|nr:hypothetical protein [Winogradskyella maritima]
MKKFLLQNKRPIYGGLLTMLFVGIGIFSLGNLSGYEARNLLESSIPGINMLCNTVILGSATILALLLTVIGISAGLDAKLKDSFYFGIINVARFDTILFITAIVLFQMFNIPIVESENVPTNWYVTIYWLTLACSSFLSGFMVVVILMLYNTVGRVIRVAGLNQETSDIILDDADSEEE